MPSAYIELGTKFIQASIWGCCCCGPPQGGGDVACEHSIKLIKEGKHLNVKIKRRSDRSINKDYNNEEFTLIL